MHLVELHGTTSTPKKVIMSDIEGEIQSGVLILIPDPYMKSYDDKDLTNKQIQIRDEDWQIVSKR